MESKSMKTQRRFLLSVNAIVMNATVLGGLIMFGSVLYSGKASAAPNITGVSGTLSTGSQFTITGSGFGTKAQAAPYLWDNFESGTVGTRIYGHNGWQQYDGDCEANTSTWGSLYTNAVVYSGNQSSVRRTTQEEDFCANYLDNLGFNQIYVSMYFNPTPYTTLGTFGVYKLIRINSGAVYHGLPDFIQQLTAPLDDYRIYEQIGRTGSDWTLYERLTPPPTWGQWNRMEVYYKHSNPAGTNNGAAVSLANYVPISNTTAIVTRPSGSTATIDTLLLPTMHSTVGSTRYNFYVDDVYIDTTPQRVEVCNTSTWAARTHCEPQIPMAWSDSSITVSTNLPHFTNGSTVYVYVIDANNNANLTGFSMTVNTTIQGLSAPNIWIVLPAAQ